MKQITFLLILSLLLVAFSGCMATGETADIAATTLPVYQFTSMLCDGTDLTVTRLVTESVSCLHDYSLNVRQVKAIEGADLIILSGAGLEDFMADSLAKKRTVDASAGIDLLESCHDHDHESHSLDHDHEHEHSHETDAHIWLSPANAIIMAENICHGLQAQYPEHTEIFAANLVSLQARLQALLDYGHTQLSQLSSQEMITFHDGFAYFAHCFHLEILAAVEEEYGSEASAQELIELIGLVREHRLAAIFIEENGSVSAADIIAAETDTNIFILNMAMTGEDYFAAMYHNIDTIKEAMG